MAQPCLPAGGRRSRVARPGFDHAGRRCPCRSRRRGLGTRTLVAADFDRRGRLGAHAAAAAADIAQARAQHARIPLLHGQSWTARPYITDTVIEQGTEIEVYEIDGAIAVVYPKHGALP